VASHRASGADVSIAARPVDRETAKAMGIMRVDDSGRVVGFLEKPQTHAEMDLVRMDPSWIDARGIPSQGRDCLASMGIYLFNRQTLVDLLSKTDYRDFGKEIFPTSIRSHRVQVDLFDGYWEDIGTIRSFYDANLGLAAHNRPFDLASAEAPIYSRARFLAPSRLDGATVKNSLVADGCLIESGAVIENSVIGLRCRIGRNVTIRNAVLMGSDTYETPEEMAAAQAAGRPLLGIGEGSIVDGVIIDKDCRIGRNVSIINEHKVMNTAAAAEVTISDGIVVLEKGTVIKDGWRL
jgi:glucose-1-phosphate adenylyltransferase